MPDVSAYNVPLSGMSRVKVWNWGPPHEKCYASLKSTAFKLPILKPIDYDKAKQIGEYIFLICDASISGIESYLLEFIIPPTIGQVV